MDKWIDVCSLNYSDALMVVVMAVVTVTLTHCLQMGNDIQTLIFLNLISSKETQDTRKVGKCACV